MALTYSTETPLNSIAPDFSLKGVTPQGTGVYSLDDFKMIHGKAARGVLIIFMCNHCPYVIAVEDRINALAKKVQPLGIAVVGINANDAKIKEDDSFENMKIKSQKKDYVFPYLLDETQKVAKAYDAVCTPDPYLYSWDEDGQARLKYRGRIDDSWKDESQVKEKSLELAIEALLVGKEISKNQIPSMGCSIKWSV